MPLTNTAVLNAKPKEKPYKLSDGGGLYLLVNTTGTRYWRYDYRFHKKEKHLRLVSMVKQRLKKQGINTTKRENY